VKQLFALVFLHDLCFDLLKLKYLYQIIWNSHSLYADFVPEKVKAADALAQRASAEI